MVDLHRHDEFSFYDGSGKAAELAQIAKEKGLTALGLSNHGNTSGNVQHYDGCKAAGIKPIMGVEGYFLPKWKEGNRGYHLCLFAADLEGYRNINIIQSKAELQKYYNPIIDFDILANHSKGVICTSACVASYSSQCIIRGEYDKCIKYLKRMQEIFGDNFYIEIQPYVISDPGLQEKVNLELIRLAQKLNIKCILTSDSHRGRKEDMDAYVKMHELKNGDPDYIRHIIGTYSERYMPERTEMFTRFCKMHREDFGIHEVRRLGSQMYDNLEEIEEKVSDTIIDDLAAMPSLPVFDKSKDSMELLTVNVKRGLKQRGVWRKEYIARAKEELGVIEANNFEDYFLIVQEYVMWAKDHGICVGPGRGSGCNCLVNYALGITDVDPIYFDLDYKRFIREDKKTLPDIDVDFETARRGEVIEHVVERYKGQAVQIASYGTYKVSNLVNDLVKTYDDFEASESDHLKKLIDSHQDSEKQIDLKELMQDPEAIRLNKKYKGIIDGFCFMYNKVKYMGTHAAGVAVSKNDIYYYTAVRYNKKDGKYFSSYNLVDLERCGIIKYDLLGLGTLSSIKTLRDITGKTGVTVDDITDEKILKAFREGKCNGIFQYDKQAAQGILQQIHTDNFNDVIAASAMNRPGPLSLGIPSIYAESKETWRAMKDKPVYAKYIEDTYGCILYQEQVNSIAVEFGGLNWNQADKLRKMDDPASLKSRKLLEQYHDEFASIFVKGMKRYGVAEPEAADLFERFLNYAFNKGHATGYALISLEEMYYKVYYPAEYWFTKLNQTNLDKNGSKFMSEAVADGSVIFLPHVNYSADFSLRKVDGEKAIQMGLSSIKGIGEKCAKFIEDERRANGVFTSFDDFYDRCKGRQVTSRVIDLLKQEGALEFNKKIYIRRVVKFNSALYSRADK